MSKYHGQADSLELLKNAYSSPNPKIKLVASKESRELVFDKAIKLNLKTETAWLSTESHKRYCLGSLWLFLQFHIKNLHKSEYYSKAAEYELETVNIADQDQIVKYFTGIMSTSACIDEELKLSLIQGKKRDHPVGGFKSADQVVKKMKEEQSMSFEEQVIEYLVAFERPVNSKSRCLTYHGGKSFIGIIKNLIDSQDKNSRIEKSKGRSRISIIYDKKRLPIIIVPHQTHSGNVSLQNIESFLIKEIYNENEVLENEMASKVQIQKTMRDHRILFEVTSRPNLLTEKDWDFVVAIFVEGKENEFDEWPHKDPKKVFEKSSGFFVHYPKTSTLYTREWKVKNLLIDRNTRYADKEVIKTIWNDIQKFIFQRI